MLEDGPILNKTRNSHIHPQEKRIKESRILWVCNPKQNLDGFFPGNYQPVKKEKRNPEQEMDQAEQRFEIQPLLNHTLQHPKKILTRKSSLTRGSSQITQLKTISSRKSRTSLQI